MRSRFLCALSFIPPLYLLSSCIFFILSVVTLNILISITKVSNFYFVVLDFPTLDIIAVVLCSHCVLNVTTYLLSSSLAILSYMSDLPTLSYFSFYLEYIKKKHTLYWAIILIPYNSSFKWYNSMVFGIATELWSHHHDQLSNIFITSIRNPITMSRHSIFPLKSPALGNH